MKRHIISILIIKGQFIDSLQRRKFSTQSLETRSHHLSILVAENSLINVFNLTLYKYGKLFCVLMCFTTTSALHLVFAFTPNHCSKRMHFFIQLFASRNVNILQCYASKQTKTTTTKKKKKNHSRLIYGNANAKNTSIKSMI